MGEAVRAIAWDLPGHAAEASLTDLKLANAVDTARYLAERVRSEIAAPIYLVGYSLGGRIASLMASELGASALRGMILFSSGLGIAGEAERAERLRQEEEWSRELLADPEEFWRKWYAQPLFSRLGPDRLQARVAAKKIHKIQYLSESLRLLSPALHPPLSEHLHATKHLLYFAGELDQKYCEIAAQVRRVCPEARVEIAPRADHRVPEGQPGFCATVIRNWLKDVEKDEHQEHQT